MDLLTLCRARREHAREVYKTTRRPRHSATNANSRCARSKEETLKVNQLSAAATRFARNVFAQALETAVEENEREREWYSNATAKARARRDEMAEEVLRLKAELGISTEDELNQPNEAYDTKRFCASIGIDPQHFVEQLMRWPTCAAL